MDQTKLFLQIALRGEWAASHPFDLLIGIPSRAVPEFLHPDHPRYSPKLAAGVDARQAMENRPDLMNGKTPKMAMKKWLRLNARKYGLVNAQGKTNELAIEEIAKGANWLLKGGAPRTQSR
jgi:hypothetical protein